MRPAWTQTTPRMFTAWTPDGKVTACCDSFGWHVYVHREDQTDKFLGSRKFLGTYETEAEALDSVQVADVPDDVSPGVADLVTWLTLRGFVTTDSGDGSNYRAGMECALPRTNVFMVVADPSRLIGETHRLYDLLTAEGISFANLEGETTGDEPVIECSWNPVDNVAVIALLGVGNDDIWRSE